MSNGRSAFVQTEISQAAAPTAPLREQLHLARTKQAGQIRAAQETLAAHIAEHEDAVATIERLKVRIAELEAAQAQHTLALSEARAAQLHDELALAQTALAASARDLDAAQEDLERLRDVRTRLQQLLHDDPRLQADLEQFHAFEPDSVKELPTLYRQTVLDLHEKLRVRVAQYLQIEKLERQLRTQAAWSLDVMVVGDPEQARIIWLLPIRADARHSINTETLRATLLEKPPEGWTVLDLSEQTWHGYRSLHALAEYQGMASLADASATLMQVAFRDLLDLGELVVQIHVAELELDAWRLAPALRIEAELIHQSGSGPQQIDHQAASTLAPSKPDEIAVASQGWYTTDDVDAWERPVKVVEGSHWNAEARRLRTLLLRMLSHGAVGSTGVPRHLLWGALPEPHRNALGTGIAQLEQHQVLFVLERADTSQKEVALNPAMLNEVQDLINQDVTPFWEPIVASVDIASAHLSQLRDRTGSLAAR